MKQPEDFFLEYKNFAWEKDSGSMIGLYDENVLIFDMWVEAQHSGLNDWSGIIREWLGSLKDERIKVIFSEIKISEGEQLAFASALIRYQAISSENAILRSMANRITLGFKKANGHWKVIHQHTSVPIDFELKGILGE